MHRLLIQFNSNHLPSVDLTEGISTLGNSEKNDITIAVEDMPVFQLQFISQGKALSVSISKESGQTLTVNGITTCDTELQPGDTLSLGPLQINIHQVTEPDMPVQQPDFSNHWSLQIRNGRMGGKRFPIQNDRPTTIGRGKDSDIVIPDPHLSKKHAEITLVNGIPMVRDLNSAVGTYHNDAPVLESPLKSGDRLRMDIFSFLVLAPGEDSNIRLPVDKPAAKKTPEELLKNIESLKNKEYEEKEWITKPTSIGNRTHVVPNHAKRFGGSFWIALIVTTLCVVGSFILIHNFS